VNFTFAPKDHQNATCDEAQNSGLFRDSLNQQKRFHEWNVSSAGGKAKEQGDGAKHNFTFHLSHVTTFHIN
jgi:hypothetical protein